MNKRLEELKKMMAEDPEDPFLKYAYSLELIAEKKLIEAYVKLEELLKVKSDYLPAYYIIARQAIELKKMEEAFDWLSKGIEIAKIQQNKHTLAELTSALEEITD